MPATGRSPTSRTAESLPPAIIAEPEPQAQPAAIVSERIEGPAETAESAEPPPIATPAETADAAPPAEQPASVYAEAAAETPVEAPADAGSETSADPADAPQPEVTVETLGGDDVIEQRETRERRRRNPIRQYKIQEVIKRRQILLVQVVKEERGNKGAALTTYLSLAGRYCVLMPNAGRGGGISRKISNPADRKRMKEVLGELNVPQGMGVILRTAGLERSTIDIKRDHEYLSRLWDSIREITMRSTAPALIYEEGDLIKRSLRDVYDTDIAQVLVEGEAGFNAAAEFMRQLVPHQAEQGRALQGADPPLPPLPGGEPVRRHAFAGRPAALRRLHRHQSDRGAGRHRRQLGPLDQGAQHRGDGAAGPTSRRPRRSPARCACATSPA